MPHPFSINQAVGDLPQRLNANKFAKFHAKRLNQSENIPKSFRGGGYFFETPCIVFRLCKASSLANFARLIPQNVSLSDEIVVGPNDFSVGGGKF